MEKYKLVMAAFIVAFCALSAYSHEIPIKDGSDAGSYYHEIANDTLSLSSSHPLNFIYKPLIPSLSRNQIVVLVYSVPPIIFNLAILFLTGNLLFLSISLFGQFMFNEAAAQMLSVSFFCVAYHFKKEWKSAPFFLLSFVAHRFGFAWTAIYAISGFTAKYANGMRLLAIPIALLWFNAAIYLSHVQLSGNGSVMLFSNGGSMEYVSLFDAVSPQTSPAIRGYAKELLMFISSFIVALAYFMFVSREPSHVSFVFFVILLSFLLLFCRYALANDFATMKANIYNEYIRTVVLSLVPIMLFFLAEEGYASQNTALHTN